MIIYYRGADVLVTSEAFVILGSPPVEFPIEELFDIHIVRGDLHPARVLTAHVAGGAVVFTVAAWPALDSPTGLLIAAAVVAVPTALGAACWRMNPRVYELRARYHDLEVGLFSSTNARTFGQVRRSMLRAVEAARDRRQPESARMK